MSRGILPLLLLSMLCLIGAIAALCLRRIPLAGGFLVGQFLLACLCLAIHHRRLVRLEKDLLENQPLLARAQQTAANVINSLPQAVALLSPEGVVDIANPSAGLFGLSKGQRIDASPHLWLISIVQEVRATRKATEPQPPVQVFKDGQELFFLPHASPLLDPEHHLAGIMVVLIDITQLRRIAEAKSGLISSVSHELRTPLTSIQMSIHLLLEDAATRLTPRQLDLLRAARDDSDRLNRLIEEMIRSARASKAS